ncbi:MAG: amphi-Trp domain-containing protein [Deltaproteobacteria bacterium]|nr:amphi-Trp domain-containing protein [Deltaproteobacteria bacterium]
MKKNEVNIKCKMETDAVAILLSDMVKSFREGKMVIQKGSSFVTLKPVGQIEVELEATEKKGKQRIEIQLSWKEAVFSEQPEDEIRISGDEPCLAEADASEEQTERNAILYRKW